MAAEYEDYTEASRYYDEGRQAIGIEVIVGAICVGTRKSLEDVHLVDLGCGTGNYTVALSPYVGRITGVEFNQGMLDRARQKTAELSNVELQQGDATQLELPDGFCDAIIINQVLHHVSDVSKVMKECYRILGPKGALIVNNSSIEQVKMQWFINLIPGIPEAAAKRYFECDCICKHMEKAGFKVASQVGLLSEIFLKPSHMYDKEGPFSEEWRKYDSTWSLISKEELEAGLARWRKMLEDGTADRFIAEIEEKRKKVGLSTSVIAYKDCV